MNIKSIEVDRWSEPDEKHCIKHEGMAKWREVFEKLRTELAHRGLLPDEYFLSDEPDNYSETELPDYNYAICVPNYGDSEGIYLDIYLTGKDNNVKWIKFATGKTLHEDLDAFFKMSLAAAVCSLLLNGRGSIYQSEKDVITLEMR